MKTTKMMKVEACLKTIMMFSAIGILVWLGYQALT